MGVRGKMDGCRKWSGIERMEGGGTGTVVLVQTTPMRVQTTVGCVALEPPFPGSWQLVGIWCILELTDESLSGLT